MSNEEDAQIIDNEGASDLTEVSKEVKLSKSSSIVNSKKKQTKELNVNLKYDSSEEHIYKYVSLKKKQRDVDNYKDIHFMSLSNFRFVYHPSSLPSISNSKDFVFEDIFIAKWYCNENYSCPICLLNLEVPIITQCGHIFCWVCFVSYYNYAIKYLAEKLKGQPPPCPLCKQPVTCSNLKFCEIIKSKKYSSIYTNPEAKDSNINSTVTLNLVTRSNYMIYNLKYDPNLNLFCQQLSKVIIPSTSMAQGSFSVIFKTDYKEMLKKLLCDKNLLESIMDNELKLPEEYKDEKRLESIFYCLNDLAKQIKEAEANSSRLEESQPEEAFDFELLKKLNFFYQEENGDTLYLHPLNYSMLLAEYKNVGKLPTQLKATILEIEKFTMTPFYKKKWIYLSHIKLGATFYFVELNLTELVSYKTTQAFSSQLNERQLIRESILEEEDYYHDICDKEKAKEEQNSLSAHEDFRVECHKTKTYDKSSNIAAEEIIKTKNEEIKIEQESTIQSKEKVSLKISCLLEGKTLEEYQAKQEEREKRFVFKNEDFPDIDKNQVEELEIQEVAVKKNGGGGGGAKKKKKKFVELK